jgi:hypothetical protein
MGANKADVYDSVCVVDPYDESILVPRDIEHHSTVFKDTGIPEVLLYLGRRTPVSMQGMTVPGQCWLLGILIVRVLFPEGLQRRQCDNSDVPGTLVPKWDFCDGFFGHTQIWLSIINLYILLK